MAQDVGTGATLTFGTSSFSAQIINITQNSQSKPVVDITIMSTTGGARRKMLGDLIDNGDMEVEIAFDPDVPPVITVASTGETVTLTCPVPTGKVTGSRFVGKGALSARNWTIPLEEKMTGSITVTWLGFITQTDSST